MTPDVSAKDATEAFRIAWNRRDLDALRLQYGQQFFRPEIAQTFPHKVEGLGVIGLAIDVCLYGSDAGSDHGIVQLGAETV